MAAWVKYRETGYVLFAIWVAGLVDILCAWFIPTSVACCYSRVAWISFLLLPCSLSLALCSGSD